MRVPFFTKYLEIVIILGALIILIFLFADLKMDLAYYELQIYKLQEKQSQLEALNQSYRNLLTRQMRENKITEHDLELFLPEFERETLRQTLKNKQGVNKK